MRMGRIFVKDQEADRSGSAGIRPCYRVQGGTDGSEVPQQPGNALIL